MRRTLRKTRRRAAILIVAIVALLAVGLSGGQLLRLQVQQHRLARRQQWSHQALWLAESGLARARARLLASPEYPGEIWQPVVADNAGSGPAARGRVEIVVKTDAAQASRRQVEVVAYYPDDPTQRVVYRRVQSVSINSE